MSESLPPPYTEHPREASSESAGHGQRQRPRRNWLRMSTPSWMYPFIGLYYFISRPFLYGFLRTRLLPCFILSIIVFTTLFIWAYLPQVFFLALFHGFNASAWINGAFLVLGEGAAIVALLFEALLVDETLVDIFDAVLINEGYEGLVAHGRLLKDEPGLNPRERLGKPVPGFGRVYSPFSLRQIVEFVAFLPLNFIPWVGVPLFLLLTGLRAGPFQHWRYFKLLGWEKRQRKSFEKKMRLSYTWFGTVHLALQLIPGLSMIFLLTTAVGSALWVVNLEKKRMEAWSSRQERSHGEEYVDNPV